MNPFARAPRWLPLFVVGAVAMLAWEARALFLPVTTIRAAGAQTYEIKEFGAGAAVGQTFRARTDGLHTAVVEFSADRPATLTVRYRLMGWAPTKVDDHWAAVIESDETVPLRSGRTRHAFSFKSIADSGGQVYQFQVQLLDSRATDAGRPAPAVAIVASMDSSLEDGNLIVGRDQIVDRDLLFEARGADSRFDDFRLRVSPQLPRVLRGDVMQWAAAIVIIALFNWAFLVFAYGTLASTNDETA